MRKAPLIAPLLALALCSVLEGEDFSTFSRVHDPDGAWSFGWSMAVSGDTLAVGDNNPRSGSVWIFERRRGNPSRFRLAKRLTSPTREEERFFGRHLKLDRDTLVVRVGFSSSVLIFSRHHGGPGAWGFVRRIETAGDVAVEGDLLAVVVDGDKVGIYQRDLGGADNWGRLATVRPKERDDPFAASLALSGRSLVVGSAFDACGTFSDICSYGYRIFEQSAADPSRWVEVLHRRGAGSGDATGYEVAVDGRIMVSTDGIRERRAGSWELTAPAAAGMALFGLALRQHSVAHWASGPKPTVVVRDRARRSDAFWPRAGELVLEVGNCGDPTLGFRELVVACPHDNPLREFGTVRIYPRTPLFANGFEGASFADWALVRGRVRLVSPGLAGSGQALAVDLDGWGGRSFVRARILERAPSVSLEFSLEPDGVQLSDQTVELALLSGGGRRQVRLTLQAAADGYRVMLSARQPGVGMVKVGATRIPSDHATRLGVRWQRASGPSKADGFVRLTKRGRVVAERQDLATSRETMSVLTLGLPAGARGTRAGTVLFDEISVHR